jgi:hypothetical protein
MSPFEAEGRESALGDASLAILTGGFPVAPDPGWFCEQAPNNVTERCFNPAASIVLPFTSQLFAAAESRQFANTGSPTALSDVR